MDSSENLSNFDVSKVSEPININPVPNSVSSTGSWINVNYAASVEESISQTSSDGLNSQTTVNLRFSWSGVKDFFCINRFSLVAKRNWIS
jgi:hypothetical protein